MKEKEDELSEEPKPSRLELSDGTTPTNELIDGAPTLALAFSSGHESRQTQGWFGSSGSGSQYVVAAQHPPWQQSSRRSH